MKVLLALLLVACSAPSVASPTAPPGTEAEAEAAYAAKQWPKCTEIYASVADRATGAPQERALYNAACCAARDGKPDRAFALLDRAVAGGLRGLRQTSTDEDLVSLHADARWTRLLAKVEGNVKVWETTLGDPLLRRELLTLQAEDQKARSSADDLDPTSAQVDAVVAVDARTTARMKQVIAAKGWPGKKLVGRDGANAAWTLVQHADADPAFQKECLALVEKAVAAGDDDPASYAYLYDRVAVAEKRLQRYGTQFGSDGEPQPLEDPANVDARRKSVGLGSFTEYRKRLRTLNGVPEK